MPASVLLSGLHKLDRFPYLGLYEEMKGANGSPTCCWKYRL